MTDNIRIEQQIADFLRKNGTIVMEFTADNGVGIIKYLKYLEDDLMVNQAETRYDLKTGKVHSYPSDMMLRPYKLNGSKDIITKLIPKLLLETQGDVVFNNRWNPIHDTCKDLEKNIYENP